MADQSDVMDVLSGLVAGIVWPNGTAEGSITGTCAQVFEGWPLPAQLDTAMQAGTTLISVYPTTSKNTTVFLQQDWLAVNGQATLLLLRTGQTIQVLGAVSTPQVCSVFINGTPYVYAVQATDTLQSIAAAIAYLVNAGVGGTQSIGSTVYISPAARVGAVRVGATGISVREIERQLDQYQISVWAPNPAVRSALAKAIDAGLKALTFINLPDYCAGRIRYVTSHWSDAYQKQAIYRRDLIFSVEYATTIIRDDMAVTQFQINRELNLANGASVEIDTIFIGNDEVITVVGSGALGSEAGLNLETEGGSYLDIDASGVIATENSELLAGEDGTFISE